MKQVATGGAVALAWITSIQAVHAQCEPTWGPMGNGLEGTVEAMAVFDDGTGPALYAGGNFQLTRTGWSETLAKWDGRAWSAIRGARTGSWSVDALAVFDDGSGPALFVGGDFNEIGGVPNTSVLAKWDGSSWAQVGVGPAFRNSAHVRTLRLFDDGSGTALYAAGSLSHNAVPLSPVSKWDGTSWTSLNAQIGSPPALAVYDDGTGPALYAGGGVTSGATNPHNVGKWDGVSWIPIGLVAGGPSFPAVETLAVYDDGTGHALYAAGHFESVDGVATANIARWDGSGWLPLGEGLNGRVQSLLAYDDGSGSALYAGGMFHKAGTNDASNVARWDGTTWTPLERGVTRVEPWTSWVASIAAYDDGEQTTLIIAGRYTQANNFATDSIARWGPLRPHVTAHPRSNFANRPGTTTTFEVAATSTAGPMFIRWHKDGQPLAENPPRITGTQLPTLTINNVTRSDAGKYDAVLQNRCGVAHTVEATLWVDCYADCDQSTGVARLDIFDFLCFQGMFLSGFPYACDCDESTGFGVCDMFDFLCYQRAFVAGCP